MKSPVSVTDLYLEINGQRSSKGVLRDGQVLLGKVGGTEVVVLSPCSQVCLKYNIKLNTFLSIVLVPVCG